MRAVLLVEDIMREILLPIFVIAGAIFLSTPSFGENTSVADTKATSIDATRCDVSVKFGPVRIGLNSSIVYSSKTKDLHGSIDGDVKTFIADEALWDEEGMRDRFLTDAHTRPSQLSLQVQLRDEKESKVAILANYPSETAFYYLDASKFELEKSCRGSSSGKPKKK